MKGIFVLAKQSRLHFFPVRDNTNTSHDSFICLCLQELTGQEFVVPDHRNPSKMGKECNMSWILTGSGCPGFHPFTQIEVKHHERKLVYIILMVMV